jgi:hypothetical protein
MAFDAARTVTVLFGGFRQSGGPSSETWEWNGTQWTQRLVQGPSARYSHSMAWDAQRNAVVLYGGAPQNGSAQTWRWDGVTWTNLTDNAPGAREAFAMCGGPGGVSLVLFGGFTPAAQSDEVWAFGQHCDPIDFNADSLFPDTLDIADFLSVFAGGVCSGQQPTNPPCNTDIDFNNDGLFPDTDDIQALLRVFAGGPCVP